MTVAARCLFVVLLSLAGSLFSEDAPCLPDELPQRLAGAQPGEVILVRNGTWEDVAWDLKGVGTEQQPVVIKAETTGGTVITGESFLFLEGKWVILDGFHFRDGWSPRKSVIELKGEHLTLRDTAIVGFNPDDVEREDKWVSLRGSGHLVEYCTFQGKSSPSVTLTVWREADGENRHRIRRNHFFDRPRGDRGNGFETIRIGTSDHSLSDSKTVVEENLFEGCDGEMEIISVKSGGNWIRNNTFLQSAGTLTLRHGSGNVVEGNLFAGRMKSETGGIRIYGKGHQIHRNVIIGTTGRSGGALTLMAGTSQPALNGYQRVEDTQIQGNLIVANVGPAVRLDGEHDEGKRNELPRNVTFEGNVFSGKDPNDLIAGSNRKGLEIRWSQNQVFLNNEIPREVTRKVPPPLTRNDVGATWFEVEEP